MRKIFLLLPFLCSVSILFGQIDSLQVNDSPYGVIYNHLFYLQDDSYDSRRASISFPSDVKGVKKKAVQLKEILDAKGYFIDINRLPKNNNFVDSIRGESIYFVEPLERRIYVEKIGEDWYYSRTTLELIPVMHKEVFPFGTGLTNQFQGPFWSSKILGLSLAKIAGLLLLLLICFVLFFIIQRLSTWIITRLLKSRSEILAKVKSELGKISRILSLFIIARTFLYFLPMIQLPVRVNYLLVRLAGVISIFFLVFLVARILKVVFHYLDDFTKKTENTLDDHLFPVISRIVNIIVWAVGFIYILEYLNVNVTALIAGISIGGLAIALAAQDTVKNFFGSLMIFIDRPFQIGDWVNFDDVDGTVEEVGIRSTRIRTFANSVVYVPNGMLADKVINNMGLRQYRRFKTSLGITYSTPPKRIELFVEGVKEIIKRHPKTRKDYYEVHLNSFAESSINILLYCFFEAPNWTEELKAKHEVMHAILILAEDIGVSFAFPSQSIYVESLPKNGNSDQSRSNELESGLNKIDEYFKQKLSNSDANKINPIGGE